jgi:6-phosphogluconolactonase
MSVSLPGGAELVVLPDPAAVANEAAARIARVLQEAIAARGVAHWATTGGSTPGPIYQRLALPPWRDAVDWRRVHLWWGDDRCVPRDHPLSNVKLADDVLLRAAAYSGQSGTGGSGVEIRDGEGAGVPIAAANVHPWPCAEGLGAGLGPTWAAARYLVEVRRHLPIRDGWPVFDLLLLGVGPDGHILSIFPGQLPPDGMVTLAVPPPDHVAPRVARVTFGPGVVTAARAVLVVCLGASKAPVITRLRTGEGIEGLPARWALRPGAVWLVDRAAAGEAPTPVLAAPAPPGEEIPTIAGRER